MRSIVFLQNFGRNSEFVLKDFSFFTSQARRIFLMSITVACLRPSYSTVFAQKWRLIFVKPNVVLEAAELQEYFSAAGLFAYPNTVHSMRGLVSLVLKDVVRIFTALVFVVRLFLNQLVRGLLVPCPI